MTEEAKRKARALELLLLLSALESWAYSVKQPLPDHTVDRLTDAIEWLSAEVLL